ncbi:MAG: HEPN domain-containing protein [Spirochaetota bacterium]
MPPSRPDPTDPQEWLRRARSNLAKAKANHDLPEVLYEDLCFDAQQAAEKAIKAALVHKQIPFPKTHDIINLLTLLQQGGVEVPEEIRRADLLTGYAVEARYPGISEEVTREDYVQAVELAEQVVRWVNSLTFPPQKQSGI